MSYWGNWIFHFLRCKDSEREGTENYFFYRHLCFCLSRGSERAEFLVPLVAGFGNNHNSLDTVSNLNSTKSEWVLVYGSSKLSVLRQTDMHKKWTSKSPPIHRYRPAYHCHYWLSYYIIVLYFCCQHYYIKTLFKLFELQVIYQNLAKISLKYFFACHSQPALGHFNDDGVLDLFFQHSANGTMKVKQFSSVFQVSNECNCSHAAQK